MEYPLVIYLSVGIFYGLGLALALGIMVKAWLWTFEQLMILLRVKRAFMEFINHRRKTKVFKPTIKKD